VGLAVVGLLAGTPFLHWLAGLNAQLPIPEWMRAMEEGRSALIEQALLHADLSVAFVLATMALTPSLFEELLFRGYLHRQAERALGPAGAIVLVGLFFGAFHLSALQVVPLAVLGVYLGVCVWATGSLWAAVAVHLVNNGLAVLVGDYLGRRPDLDLAALEAVSVPWYLALISAAGLLAAGWALAHRRRARLDNAPL
jgi:membrane protease YdiL (CAAX protease family)